MATLFRRSRAASTTSSIAPSYHTISPSDSDPNPRDHQDLIELGTLGSVSNASLPTYADATGEDSSENPPEGGRPFVATQKLRIETAGKPLFGLPLPPRPDPIPIYDVTSGICPAAPLYVSLRPNRNSGTCHLARGDDPHETPLCTTTYRWGPGKPPVISLHRGDGGPATTPPTSPLAGCSSSSPRSSEQGDEGEDDEGQGSGSTVDSPFTSPKLLRRTQLLRSPYGTFTWRYASRQERKPFGADSLLVMERVVRVALPGGRSEERRTAVARLVRGEDTRSEGSGRSTAGNGGLLEVDLRDWADAKDEVEQVRLLVVASCVSMLKKEVDRRRMHQAIVIMAAVSGGP